MHIVVCIVGFRNPDDIVTCLQALARSTYAAFEVVICENGGAASAEALRRVLPERLVSGQSVALVQADTNLGYAGGINACIAHGSGADAWWILNPDTVPEPPALERLYAKLSEGACDAVAGTVHYADGTVESRGGAWNRWLARATSLDHGRPMNDPVDTPALEARVNYLTGASMLVSRSFVEKAGVMQEDYFLYVEEIEWCLRAGKAGLRFGLAPEARVLHHKGTTTGGVSRVSERGRMPVYLDERNKILATRDCFPALLPIAAMGALVLIVLRFGRAFAWRQLGYGLAGWRAGLSNERGAPAWVRRDLDENKSDAISP
jgi:N-acetylglucosaminyl-diphospho-decaprenol L-rhamnosyltransferase